MSAAHPSRLRCRASGAIFAPMDALAAGFWGVYFGTVGMMLMGSALAFSRSLRFVSMNTAISAVLSALFAITFLGWLPVGDADAQARVQAVVAVSSSVVLAYLLLWMLGVMRSRAWRRRAAWALGVLGLALLLVCLRIAPWPALLVGSVAACALALAGFVLCAVHARRGDRPAGAALLAVAFMLMALVGLSWIALNAGQVAWFVHAFSALAGAAFLVTMASVLWRRYSYLIELHQIMALGPTYDPVTRMRSHSDTGQMLGAAFRQYRERPAPLGMIVLSIGNLYALEQLHGRPAVNHALFVCAGRLRSCMPARAETGRLAEDGFLVLVHQCEDGEKLLELARKLATRMSRPVVLSTGRDPDELDNRKTQWAASAGIGVLLVADPRANAAQSVAIARAMSRTAWSYASRIAWYDEVAGAIAELPVTDDTLADTPAFARAARIIGAPVR